MPNITLPDGKKINFKDKINGLEIAEKISKSLIKQALIMSVNGELKDLTHLIKNDSSVKIITNKVEILNNIQSKARQIRYKKLSEYCLKHKKFFFILKTNIK